MHHNSSTSRLLLQHLNGWVVNHLFADFHVLHSTPLRTFQIDVIHWLIEKARISGGYFFCKAVIIISLGLICERRDRSFVVLRICVLKRGLWNNYFWLFFWQSGYRSPRLLNKPCICSTRSGSATIIWMHKMKYWDVMVWHILKHVQTLLARVHSQVRSIYTIGHHATVLVVHWIEQGDSLSTHFYYSYSYSN